MTKKRRDQSDDAGQPVRRCLYDGTQLDKQGWCLAGNGFPDYFKCPFVCPRCREPLGWAGACLSCYGTDTPADRASWTFTGARYDTHDDDGKPIGDGQHWVKTGELGVKVVSGDEIGRHVARMTKMLVEKMTGMNREDST